MVEDPTTPGQIVGRNVRTVREEQLLSQRELAERSGVAKITIATMELGRSAHPRRRTVEKLAGALGVPLEDLIREDLTRPKEEAPPSLEPTLFNGLAEERRVVVSGEGTGELIELPESFRQAGAAERVRVAFDLLLEELRRAGASTAEIARIEETRTDALRELRTG